MSGSPARSQETKKRDSETGLSLFARPAVWKGGERSLWDKRYLYRVSLEIFADYRLLARIGRRAIRIDLQSLLNLDKCF